MSKQTKKVTLESLANKVDKLASTMETGFKQVNAKMDVGFKKVGEDIESLARMTAQRFENTPTKDDIKSVKESLYALEQGLSTLEQGQENIQLRVDSLAPQFEVKGLERRVKRLEDRAGIRHTIHSN